MVDVSLQHLPVPINFLHELYRGETIQTTTLIEPIFDSNSKTWQWQFVSRLSHISKAMICKGILRFFKSYPALLHLQTHSNMNITGK